MDNVNTTADKISRMYSEKYTEIQNIGRSLDEYKNAGMTGINTVALNAGEIDAVYANGGGSIDNADFNNASIISLSGTETLKDTVIKNVTMEGFNAENVSLQNFNVDNVVINTNVDTELNNVITDSLNVSSIFGSTLENPYIESISATGLVPSEYRPVINNSTFANVLIENPDVDFDDAHVPELIANKGTVNSLYVDATKERISSSVGLMLNEETSRIVTAFPTVDDIVFEENRDYMYTSDEGNLLYGNSSHLIEESDSLITASGVYNACTNNYEIPEKVNDYFTPVYDDTELALFDRQDEIVYHTLMMLESVNEDLGINETRFNMLFRMYQEHAGFIFNDFNQNLNEINNQVNNNFNDINLWAQDMQNFSSDEIASTSSLYVNAITLANSWAVPFNDSMPWNARIAYNTDFYNKFVYTTDIHYANLPASTSGLTLISKNSDFGAIYVGFSSNATNNITTFYSRVNAASVVGKTNLNPSRFYGKNCYSAFRNTYLVKSGYPTYLNGVEDARYMFAEGYNLNQTFHLCNTITNAVQMFRNCRGLNSSVTFDADFSGDLNRTFWNCTNFNANVFLPNASNFVYTFYVCSNFNQNIQIPSSARSITGLFSTCVNLNQNIQIPSGVTAMASTFMDCRNLNQNIRIPEGVTAMNQCFNWCNKLQQNILVPSTATGLYMAFSNCHLLRTVSIKSTAITTLQNAFRNCQNLTSIYINHLIPKSTSNAIYNALVNGYAYGNNSYHWTVYNTL